MMQHAKEHLEDTTQRSSLWQLLCTCSNCRVSSSYMKLNSVSSSYMN